jgi:S1-C subfamily serine protease
MGENIGTAARAMLNFGLTELRLVRPDCGWPSAKAVAAASGAVEVLNGVRVYDALTDALADHEPGDRVDVEVAREGGGTRTVPVTLGTRPERTP